MVGESQQRPTLELGVEAQDFLAFYWLKSELVEFCRANGLPTGVQRVS